MRVVIQRTTKASVTIDQKITGSIGAGLVILLGIEAADTEEDIHWLVRKTSNLRIFDDSEGVMNKSILDTGGDILLISQFTLHASTKKGNRPSYTLAAHPDYAIPLYEKFIKQMELALGKPIETGEFGAMMQVELINDGPVTIWMDTKNKA
jgi:D-tyrosyl-tRNA(Tyr) deacylase